MALNVTANVTDSIVVTIIPAPIIMCISCKKEIGKYIGRGKAIDEGGKVLPGKCPMCKRNWLACINGEIVIKTKKEFIKC